MICHSQDIPATFFYLLIAVVMHQIIQEYILDKVNRKLHLSKVKHAKFNESGQLLSFYLVSIVWAGDILLRENLFHIRTLWEGYPHTSMTFMFKFFYIVQIAYWLHIFPELYFQKVKREDMGARIQYAVLYLLFIGGNLAAAWLLGRRPASPWGERLVWLTLGAALYATLLVVPPHMGWWVLAFALFRLFDIWKPWPIRDLDHRLGGGAGIMLDDLVAALYAALILGFAVRFVV